MEQYKAKLMAISGKVMHYAWGGYYYLPELLHQAFKNGEPSAEYWLGAHTSASALLFPPGGKPVPLNEYIDAYPEEILGTAAKKSFGRLPYLLKILDVKDMLSIQVHPDKENAEKEFAAENRLGISVSSPTRNYKDDNHKPELMVALGDFWLLHGFKPVTALKKILSATPELHFLAPVFGEGNYRALYAAVMEMPQAEVNKTLQPLLDRIVPRYEDDKLNRNSEDFWAARAAKIYNQNGNTDRGIFSVYLFNLVNTRTGDAVFQDAGLPHAYLEGQNVEIMANSDNVLRGGLTPKHVDVPELMKHIRFVATEPKIIKAVPAGEGLAVFPTPARDFELAVTSLTPGQHLSFVSRSVQVYLVLEGDVIVTETPGQPIARKRGEAWITFDQAVFSVTAVSRAVIYRAAIPA